MAENSVNFLDCSHQNIVLKDVYRNMLRVRSGRLWVDYCWKDLHFFFDLLKAFLDGSTEVSFYSKINTEPQNKISPYCKLKIPNQQLTHVPTAVCVTHLGHGATLRVMSLFPGQ